MLSDEKIIELIHIYTYAYLSKSHYSTLRQHCLEQQPLAIVIEQIREHIDQLVANEKREYSAIQVSQACAKQQKQDIEENARETEEAEIEKHLELSLKKELDNINDSLELMRQEKSKQEEILSELSLSNDILTKQIRQPGTAKSALEHSHSEDGRKHVNHEHEHEPQNANQVHNHSHSQQAPAHKELIKVLSPMPAEAQSQLISPKEQIEAQHSTAQKKLKNTLAIIEKLSKRRDELNIKLMFEIPQKQKALHERFSARQLRESARINQESLQAQLSPQNYSLMVDLIHKFNTQKESHGKLTMTKAEKFAYREYIYCLINYLRTNQSHTLSFYEISALETIAHLMQESLSVADEETSKLLILKTELQVKWRLDNTLSQSEEELLSLLRANPMLNNQNSRFDEDNKKLGKTIKKRLQDRNKLLNIGAGVLLLTLITALLAFFGGLELIFFTPSALCATATLGLFVTSLIYTAQNNSDRYQLKQNEASIRANSAKISTQTEQILTLEEVTIPELQIQINKAHLKIETLKQEIGNLQKRQQHIIGKANNVTLSITANIYPTPSSSTTKRDSDPFTKIYDSKQETDGNSPRL